MSLGPLRFLTYPVMCSTGAARLGADLPPTTPQTNMCLLQASLKLPLYHSCLNAYQSSRDDVKSTFKLQPPCSAPTRLNPNFTTSTEEPQVQGLADTRYHLSYNLASSPTPRAGRRVHVLSLVGAPSCSEIETLAHGDEIGE